MVLWWVLIEHWRLIYRYSIVLLFLAGVDGVGESFTVTVSYRCRCFCLCAGMEMGGERCSGLGGFDFLNTGSTGNFAALVERSPSGGFFQVGGTGISLRAVFMSDGR